MGIICLFIKSYWRTLKRKHSARAAKCLKDYSYKAYILRKKYTRMFVLGHYLFLEARRFPRASLSETVRILEQRMSEDKHSCIFLRQVEAIVSILLRYN